VHDIPPSPRSTLSQYRSAGYCIRRGKDVHSRRCSLLCTPTPSLQLLSSSVLCMTPVSPSCSSTSTFAPGPTENQAGCGPRVPGCDDTGLKRAKIVLGDGASGGRKWSGDGGWGK
jgi:hypothetical protein